MNYGAPIALSSGEIKHLPRTVADIYNILFKLESLQNISLNQYIDAFKEVNLLVNAKLNHYSSSSKISKALTLTHRPTFDFIEKVSTMSNYLLEKLENMDLHTLIQKAGNIEQLKNLFLKMQNSEKFDLFLDMPYIATEDTFDLPDSLKEYIDKTLNSPIEEIDTLTNLKNTLLLTIECAEKFDSNTDYEDELEALTQGKSTEFMLKRKDDRHSNSSTTKATTQKSKSSERNKTSTSLVSFFTLNITDKKEQEPLYNINKKDLMPG